MNHSVFIGGTYVSSKNLSFKAVIPRFELLENFFYLKRI